MSQYSDVIEKTERVLSNASVLLYAANDRIYQDDPKKALIILNEVKTRVTLALLNVDNIIATLEETRALPAT